MPRPRESRSDRVQTASARERILRVAARLYAHRGYEGTSMRQIAVAAGVTKSLVSYHFGSKQELFASLLREALGACRGTARTVLQQDIGAAEQLRAMLQAQFARAREAPEVVAFAHEVMTMPGLLPLGYDYKAEGRELVGSYVALIAAGRRAGEFRAVDARAVAVIASAAVSMYASAVLSGDLKQIPPRAAEDVFDLVMHGIGDATPRKPRSAARLRTAGVRRRTPRHAPTKQMDSSSAPRWRAR